MSAPADWFRSAEMEYISLMIHEQCAHRVACDLGRLGIMQFTDLSPELTPFQRRYIREIQRCVEVEKRLKYFEDMLAKFRIKAKPAPEVNDFLDDLDRRIGGQSPIVLIDQLEAIIFDKEKELLNLSNYGTTLAAVHSAKIELKAVLEKIRVFGRDADPEAPRGAQNTTGVGIGTEGAIQDRSMKFRFITGVVIKEDRADFARTVFRTTRGNCFMKFFEIEEPLPDTRQDSKSDPKSKGTVFKDVFIIFFQAPYIEEKLKRVCDSFSTKIYAVPNIEDVQEITNLINDTANDINEGSRVVRKNTYDTTKLLRELSQNLELWKYTIRHEKVIYHNLNLFTPDVTGFLRAEGWVIAREKQVVIDTVERVHASVTGDENRNLPSWVTTVGKEEWPGKAPTYFRTNKFTGVFQVIIDTYGIPRYQEANPALFAAVCFPFMFGVMFGDMGHGLLLFLFASLLVLFEDKLAKQDLGELGSLLYGGRYLLFLNGFFALYAGFMYNDCFGMGLWLFKVTWAPLPAELNPETNQSVVNFVRSPPNAVYSAGVDPTWHISENSLLYFNSFKMKMAVIIGVLQMSGGIILRGLNAIHYNKGGLNLDLWFEAVPMFIFMQSLFGYMCFMIFYKWGLSWEPDCGRQISCGTPNCSCYNPPSLITTLINMVLQPGTVSNPLYANQGTAQAALVLIALIMIPILLIPKPWILIRRHRHAHHATEEQKPILDGHDTEEPQAGAIDAAAGDAVGSNVSLKTGGKSKSSHGKKPAQEEHGAGDIIIHQAIETIEFVLGCISNTASYLRLWALSLAHSQLSEVFLSRTVMSLAVNTGPVGPIGTWGACAVFFCITFAVILCMDNLECFLHALRLVWVEFMNKFYKAEGLKFTPLDFTASLIGIEK